MAFKSEEMDWLSPDIIQDLLYDDMCEKPGESNGPGESKLHARKKVYKKGLKEVSMEEVVKLVDNIDKDAKLSPYGLEKVKTWMNDFNTHGNTAYIAGLFADHCLEASKFFASSGADPRRNLLAILKGITSENIPIEVVRQSGEVAEFENSTLEYLGGYILRKATIKYGPCEALDVMCTDIRQGYLITLMEKRVGSLFTPSDEYLLFIQHAYIQLTAEVGKRPDTIDFHGFTETLLSGQYFCNLVRNIQSQCSGMNEEITKDIITYMISLLIRVLAHSFAKKLFQRMKKKLVPSSRGLRGDLKLKLTQNASVLK